MLFLLDTNVIRESTRPEPSRKVLSWLVQRELSCYISVVSMGEIWKGIRLLPEGGRRAAYESWITDQVGGFANRILPVDLEVIKTWADYCANHERSARRVGVIDSLIGATALQHDLTLATRNTKDFPGIPVVNPWS